MDLEPEGDMLAEAVDEGGERRAEGDTTCQQRPFVVGDELQLAEDIRLHVLEVRGGQVKLGIDAPRRTVVRRGEAVPHDTKRVGAQQIIRALREPRSGGGPKIRYKRSKLRENE